MKKQSLWILLVSALTACGEQGMNPVETTRPTALAAPASPSSIVSPLPRTGNRLSGTVIERTAFGVRPVPGGTVFFWPPDRPSAQVQVNSEGQYVIPDVELGSVVRLVAAAGPGSDKFYQPCATNAIIAAAETYRDIEVARVGSREASYESPILSGAVFETTAEGRRPLAHTRVLYASGPGGYDAYTETDDEGKYAFCRIPPGDGRVGAGDCNDAAFFVSSDVHGDTVVDVDLTEFYASCPGAVRR